MPLGGAVCCTGGGIASCWTKTGSNVGVVDANTLAHSSTRHLNSIYDIDYMVRGQRQYGDAKYAAFAGKATPEVGRIVRTTLAVARL